jgi:hypothetical protein
MMYKLLLAAGAAALAVAAPASAQPGHAKGHGKHQAKHGRIYQGHLGSNYWGKANCPPGLAKKRNGCLPPGIAKQRYNVGDRWTGNYNPWAYNQIPLDWRTQYQLDRYNRYYYRDGYLYSVDPRTRLVEAVIQALIH